MAYKKKKLRNELSFKRINFTDLHCFKYEFPSCHWKVAFTKKIYFQVSRKLTTPIRSTLLARCGSVHLYLRNQEAEAGELLYISGQPGLHSEGKAGLTETLSQKTKQDSQGQKTNAVSVEDL